MKCHDFGAPIDADSAENATADLLQVASYPYVNGIDGTKPEKKCISRGHA
jgi:hypothetical protein